MHLSLDQSGAQAGLLLVLVLLFFVGSTSQSSRFDTRRDRHLDHLTAGVHFDSVLLRDKVQVLLQELEVAQT